MDDLLSKVDLWKLTVLDRSSSRKLSDPLTRVLHTNFFGSVERTLRQEGGGLEYALGTVLTRYMAALERVPEQGAGGTLQSLTGMAENVLATVLEHRTRTGNRGAPYVAFASSLMLAEAVSLGPGLAGLVVGEGADQEIRTAARLLKVAAVIGAPSPCRFAQEGDVVKVDGASGTVEILVRVVTKVG